MEEKYVVMEGIRERKGEVVGGKQIKVILKEKKRWRRDGVVENGKIIRIEVDGKCNGGKKMKENKEKKLVDDVRWRRGSV